MLLDLPGFSAVIVAVNGTIARINTAYPAAFVAFKWWLGGQALPRPPLASAPVATPPAPPPLWNDSRLHDGDADEMVVIAHNGDKLRRFIWE
jgi:hypothetical protein